MKQTDPLTGAVLRRLRLQSLTGNATADQAMLLAHYNTTKAEQDKIDRDWPLGGPELNHKPPDPILKSILLGHVQDSPNTAISKIYADSLEGPTGHGPLDISTASLIRQIKELQNAQRGGNKLKKCKNCTGLHDSWDCPSKKCHFPGCNASTFASAEERRQYYVDTHSRHAQKVSNSGRGSQSGRGGRGGRSGRGGRYSSRGGPDRDHPEGTSKEGTFAIRSIRNPTRACPTTRNTTAPTRHQRSTSDSSEIDTPHCDTHETAPQAPSPVASLTSSDNAYYDDLYRTRCENDPDCDPLYQMIPASLRGCPPITMTNMTWDEYDRFQSDYEDNEEPDPFDYLNDSTTSTTGFEAANAASDRLTSAPRKSTRSSSTLCQRTPRTVAIKPTMSVSVPTAIVSRNGNTGTLCDHDANPQLVTRITPTPPRTALVFGNNQSQATTQLAHIGDYTAHTTPSSMPDCIIAHAPIIDAGHIIIVETKTETIIRDIGEQYEVRYPKPANSNEWPLLLDVLNQLSNLRRNYPLTIDNTARMLQPYCFESARAIQDDEFIRPPLSYIYSSRIHRCARGVSTRSRRFHDSMCAGLTNQPGFDSPVWVNAPVTVDEIRAAFRHEPCLLSVLAKRHKEGTLHWLKKAAAHKNSKLRIKQETPEVEASIKALLIEDQKMKLGEILYLDYVPVNPTSIGGKSYFFAIRVTKGRKIFTYPTRHNDDAAYHKCLGKVLAFFKNLYLSRPELGTRPQTIIRTDRVKTFLSEKSQQFYLDNNCLHQPASAYRHHQVAAERDIQTIVQNVTAAVHTNDSIRVSSWDQAVVHWTELHGHTPLSESGLTPNQMLYRGSTSEDHKKHWIVNCDKQYRFAFGDIR
eukprot:gene33646-biopygen26641